MNRLVTSLFALALPVSFAGAAFASAAEAAAATRVASSTTVLVNPSAKLVSFHLRNDSGAAMTLQLGEQQITVEAGKTADIKAKEGIQIVCVNAAGHFTAGAVLTTVIPELSGNTVAIK